MRLSHLPTVIAFSMMTKRFICYVSWPYFTPYYIIEVLGPQLRN